MRQSRTYLDYNATAPLRPAAHAALVAAMAEIGNPSSVHAEGRRARAIVESAREQVARLVNAKPSEVVFTSGAAEANATVMAGSWSDILTARIEHDSVLAGLGRPETTVSDIPVDSHGAVAIETVAQRIETAAPMARPLVVLQLANNETGVIQPVAVTAALARANAVALHCDAVQALGRIPVDFAALGVDFMSLSAHKIGGPKGIGALVVREGAALPALIPGGQERRRRGGTENVASIAGFGAAAREALAGLSDMARLVLLRDRLEHEIRMLEPAVVIIGAETTRLANTTCMAFPGMRAETLVIQLDLMGFAVSAGAACSSGRVGASHVLTAMGLAPEIVRGAVRVSLGHESREADIDNFIGAIREIVAPTLRRHTLRL